MNQRITQNWQELADFLIFRNSLDLGALSKLMEMLLLDASFQPSSFADQIVTFLNGISSQGKLRPHGQSDMLALLSVDSLISNLYSYVKNGQPFQANSSSFYGWMSSSQMSMDHSQLSDRQGQVVVEMVAGLANNQQFFKRLKLSLDKTRNQEKGKLYIQGLLQTLDAIMGKERLSREIFNKLRGKYIGLERCRKWQVNYSQVNHVIFSSQLNKVLAVLTQGGDNVHLALLRIYLTYSEECKMYEGVKFSGDQMLANLYRYYISSFREVDQLFQQGKHPLFRLIRNHLALYFTPTLRKFHQIVVKIASRCGGQQGYQFYKSGSGYLQSQFSEFINQLPNDLLKLLSQLKQLVEEQYPNITQEVSLVAVKKMFFYSFLLNQSVIDELYPRHDPSKWSVAYNHILNLFFHSSIKKYHNLPQNQQQYISQLVDKLAGSLDSRIIHLYVKLDTEEVGGFKIRDNILNHDYQVVGNVLNSLEFTPKDSKQFEMKKVVNVLPQSPVYRHFKTQAFKQQEREEQLQLATWMSVGGSRDWGSTKQSFNIKRGLPERLSKLKVMEVSVRSRLQSQSESLLQYFYS